MDISWFGHASFKLKGKAATVVTDPYESQIGIKLPKVEADIVTITHSHFDHNAVSLVGGEPFVIEGPGEYEIKGVSVIGVDSFHDEKKGAERGKNTLYNIQIDGLNIAHLGDLGQSELTAEQIEELGNVDILLVPVGGFYTIDAATAAKITSSLEPKIVIPMHYKTEEVTIKEIEGVDKFLKEMAKETPEKLPRLVITKDKLPEELQLVLLERTG